MTRTWLTAATLALCVACDANQIPTRPSPPTASSVPRPVDPRRQTISLDENVDVDLDMNVNGVVSCEVREDPTPCARFDVNVPRSGILRIQIDFDPVDPMFLFLYQSGSPAVFVEAHSDRSPFAFRQMVDPGLVHVSTGPEVPWGRQGSVRFHLVATLE